VISAFGFGDPGPCPVDDAPHTTCVSPDYVPLTEPVLSAGSPRPPLMVPLRRPLMLDRAMSPPVQSHTEVVVTTKTYRRGRRLP